MNEEMGEVDSGWGDGSVDEWVSGQSVKHRPGPLTVRQEMGEGMGEEMGEEKGQWVT